MHSHLHFAPSTRTISAEGCAGQIHNAISPALRAFDTHDLCRGCPGQIQNAISSAFRVLDMHNLRRGLPATKPNRTLACISRPRHARSLQKIAHDKSKMQSHLHFMPSTRTSSAERCPRQIENAFSFEFRALDTHDLRGGLRFVVLRQYRPRP